MVKELMKLVGKDCVVKTEGLLVECRIEDVRDNYGKTQVLVAPLAGAGKAWKNLEGRGVQLK